jgi:hypothetical protein
MFSFYIIDFCIRCFYGIGVFGFGLISFIPNIMMSDSESNIKSAYIGIYASFLFCSSGILGLLNSSYIPLYFANISLGLAVLLEISALSLLK